MEDFKKISLKDKVKKEKNQKNKKNNSVNAMFGIMQMAYGIVRSNNKIKLAVIVAGYLILCGIVINTYIIINSMIYFINSIIDLINLILK